MKGYSTREVAKLLGTTPQRIRRLARREIVAPLRNTRGHFRFSFQDIVLIRTTKKLTEAAIDPRRIWGAIRAIAKYLPVRHAFSAIRMRLNGDRMLVSLNNSSWEPESGQFVLPFCADQLADKSAIRLLAKRQASPQRGDH